jgi:hypothetical protein
MGDPGPTELCLNAQVGFVNAGSTSTLDAILGRYEAAGCVVSYCPGPPAHKVSCRANASGRNTCDGI